MDVFDDFILLSSELFRPNSNIPLKYLWEWCIMDEIGNLKAEDLKMDETVEMDETIPQTVPYFVYEGEITRQERHIKRLWIALIVAIVLIFASNAAWLFYESLYDTISYKQDGAGLNNVNTGTQGDIYGTDSEIPETQK